MKKVLSFKSPVLSQKRITSHKVSNVIPSAASDLLLLLVLSVRWLSNSGSLISGLASEFRFSIFDFPFSVFHNLHHGSK